MQIKLPKSVKTVFVVTLHVFFLSNLRHGHWGYIFILLILVATLLVALVLAGFFVCFMFCFSFLSQTLRADHCCCPSPAMIPSDILVNKLNA